MDKDRFEITYKEGGVGAFETIITGGLAKVGEKVLDGLTGDDDHGWVCTIYDKKTNLKSSYWGPTKKEARQKAWEELETKAENLEREENRKIEEAREERHRQARLVERKRAEVQRQQSSSNETVDEIGLTIELVKWGGIIIIGITIVLVAFFSAPLLLLGFYLWKERKMNWVAFISMAFSLYFVYDFMAGGYVSTKLSRFSAGNEPYFALAYVVLFAAALGFFIEKYTASKVPVNARGSFFEQKNIPERRPIIAGAAALLPLIFGIFLLFGSSSVGNYHNTKQTIHSGSNHADYTQSIHALLRAEEKRDFQKISSFYAPSVNRYWNTYNINHSQLREQYENAWRNSRNATNEVQSILRIGPYDYYLITKFNFFDLKQKKYKTVLSKVYYEFNEDGLIKSISQEKKSL